MELGSLADWFSGLCNAVMAGAAVYAAYNAKDWLTTRKLDDAYQTAIKLTNALKKTKDTILCYRDGGNPQNIFDNSEKLKKFALAFKEHQSVVMLEITTIFQLYNDLELFGARVKDKSTYDILTFSYISYVAHIETMVKSINEGDIPRAKSVNSEIDEIFEDISNNITAFYKELTELFDFKQSA